MVKVTVDGYPCEMDDTAAVAVKKLEQQLAEARAELAKPPKLKVGDKLCNEAEVNGLLNELRVENKKLRDDALTPEKFKQQYAAEQKVRVMVKDMLPNMEIKEDADANVVCVDALKQLEANPAMKAQIAAVLDGVAIDKAATADIQRAVRTVHASFATDRSTDHQHDRNIRLGREILRGLDSKGNGNQLDGRDAWIHRLENMMNQKADKSLEEL